MKRLSEQMSNSFEAGLLRAARAEAPSIQAREKALEAALSVLRIHSTTGEEVSSAGAGPSAGATAVHWATGIVVAIATTVGGLWAWNSVRAPIPTPEVVQVSTPVVQGETPAPVVEVPPPAAPIPSPTEPAIVLKAAPPQNRKVARVQKPPAELPVDDAFHRQVKLMTSARASLVESQYERVLEALGQYEREWPRGVFTVEVELMRIEVLMKQRRMDEAKERIEAFSQRHKAPLHQRQAQELLQRLNALSAP